MLLILLLSRFVLQFAEMDFEKGLKVVMMQIENLMMVVPIQVAKLKQVGHAQYQEERLLGTSALLFAVMVLL